MSDDLRELYAERVRQVSALLRGIENLTDVEAIVSSAESRAAAMERLSSVLGLDSDQCRLIIDMRLDQLLPANVEMLRQEMADLLAYLDET